MKYTRRFTDEIGPKVRDVKAGGSELRMLMLTFDPPGGSGGIEGRTRAYTMNLLKRGIHVEVAALAPGGGGAPESFSGTRLTRHSSSLSRLPWTLSSLVRESSSSHLDSIFFLSGGSTPLGILLLCFARLTNKRSGAFFYGKDVLQYRRHSWGRLLLVFSIILARRVATNSHYTASLLPIRPRRGVIVIYPGVDSEPVERATYSRGDNGPVRILFVGRLVRRKGADLLLRSFGRLRPEIPGARLDIVGDGPEMKNLTALSDVLHLGEAVSFHGALYGKDLWSMYAGASLLAMPARASADDAEGFGTVFLEAGAFGVPSVATWTGGIPEAVINGVTGRLVRSEDVEGLTKAMRDLVADPVERERLGANARARAADFSWASSTDQMLRLMGS
jgi:glycosyltransferase involved in cell wall biosynthesis